MGRVSNFLGIGGQESSKQNSKGSKKASGDAIPSRDGSRFNDFLQSIPRQKADMSEDKYRETVVEHVAEFVQSVLQPQRDTQKRLEDHLAEIEAAMSNEEDKHIRHVRELETGHGDHVRSLQGQHIEGIRRLQADHARKENELRQDVANLGESLFRAGQEKERTYERHEKALQSLRDEMASAHQLHNRELASLEQQYVEERLRLIQAQSDREDLLIQDHSEREEAMLSGHRREVQHFRSQIKELNAALLERDDELYTGKLFSTSGLPQMTDGKLKDSFTKIHAAVDYLGRLEWRADQRVWSPRDLEARRGPHVLKKVQKAILQDAIWCLLFEFVFASPFRMFGDQGQKLEREWLAQADQGNTLLACLRTVNERDPDFTTDVRSGGNSFAWPRPSARTERWRYMTLAKCREALTQPVSGLDARAQVKKGFQDGLEELTRRLKAAIESLTAVDADAFRKAGELARLAMTTWLDFQMHRCRIMAGLPGSRTKDSSERSNAVRNGPAVLTLLPNLQRYGNVKGAELDVAVTIAGCGGETLELS